MTCIYKRTPEVWECSTSSEVTYRNNLDEGLCINPFSIITGILESGRTLAEVLLASIIIQLPSDYCCPENTLYFFGSSAKVLVLEESLSGAVFWTSALGFTSMVSVTEYLKIEEQFVTVPVTDFEANETTANCMNSFLATTEIAGILDTGLIEMGSFANYNIGCDILTQLSDDNISTILTYGLVISCDKTLLFIGSIEDYLKYAEAVGL